MSKANAHVFSFLSISINILLLRKRKEKKRKQKRRKAKGGAVGEREESTEQQGAEQSSKDETRRAIGGVAMAMALPHPYS